MVVVWRQGPEGPGVQGSRDPGVQGPGVQGSKDQGSRGSIFEPKISNCIGGKEQRDGGHGVDFRSRIGNCIRGKGAASGGAMHAGSRDFSRFLLSSRMGRPYNESLQQCRQLSGILTLHIVPGGTVADKKYDFVTTVVSFRLIWCNI